MNHTAGGLLAFAQLGGNEHDTWRRPRSESSADAESVYMTNMVIDSGYHGMHSRKSSVSPTRIRVYPATSLIYLAFFLGADQEHEHNQKAILLLWRRQGVVHRVVALGPRGLGRLRLRAGGAFRFRVCNTSNN